MHLEDFALIQEGLFEACRALRKAGQAEYAGGTNAFGNFERLAAELNISRENVLWVYAMKHKDGIVSYLNGHKSQREDVRGRIKDLIVYLTLLYGMIEENERISTPKQKLFKPKSGEALGGWCANCGLGIDNHISSPAGYACPEDKRGLVTEETRLIGSK